MLLVNRVSTGNVVPDRVSEAEFIIFGFKYPCSSQHPPSIGFFPWSGCTCRVCMDFEYTRESINSSDNLRTGN